MTKIYKEAKDQHVAYVLVYGVLDSNTEGTLYVDENHTIPLTAEQAADLFEHSKMRIAFKKSNSTHYVVPLMKLDNDVYVTFGDAVAHVQWKVGASA